MTEENWPALHRTQTDVLVLPARALNMPARQREHVLAALPVWYPPLLQLVQDVEPDALENRPGLHLRQTDAPVRFEYQPGLQGRQASGLVEPADERNVPLSHKRQEVLPGICWYPPGRHAVQLPVPELEENQPGWQELHTLPP